MKRKFRLLFAMTLGMCVISAHVWAQAVKNLPDALRMAYTQNPALHAQRMRLKITEEQLDQAYADFRPNIFSQLGVTSIKQDGSNFGSGGSSNTTSKDVSFNATQPLYRGGRTKAAIETAKHTIAAAHAELHEQEQGLMLDVITAYTDVLKDQHIVVLREGDLADIQEELEAAHLRYEVGDNTKTDVALAESRLARTKADLKKAEGALKQSAAVYKELVGEAPLYLNTPALPSLDLPIDLESAKVQAISNHPAVIMAEELYYAQKMSINEIKGELLPEIDLSGLWSRTFDPSPGIVDRQTNQSVGMEAKIPLYMGGGVRSRIRAAKYSSEDYKFRVEVVRREVIRNLVSEWANWQAALSEITAREEQVKASKIALEGMELERDLGTRSLLDVLTANQDLTLARSALLLAQRDEIISRFAVLVAMGALNYESVDAG